jgi:hypothetical protein
VWEQVDHELLPEESFDELQLFRRDGDVQVEADHGLHVGIDRLTARQAVADPWASSRAISRSRKSARSSTTAFQNTCACMMPTEGTRYRGSVAFFLPLR